MSADRWTADQNACRIYTSDVPNLWFYFLFFSLLLEIEILAHECQVSRCLRYVALLWLEWSFISVLFNPLLKLYQWCFGVCLEGFDLSSKRLLQEPIIPCYYFVMLWEVIIIIIIISFFFWSHGVFCLFLEVKSIQKPLLSLMVLGNVGLYETHFLPTVFSTVRSFAALNDLIRGSCCFLLSLAVDYLIKYLY